MRRFGDRALAWVDRYLEQGRVRQTREHGDGPLFLSKFGKALSPRTVTLAVRKYVSAAGITKNGAAHLFRHTAATLMLEAGADVRYIQALLGHVELSSTQIYTQVSITRLKEVHSETHPGSSN